MEYAKFKFIIGFVFLTSFFSCSLEPIVADRDVVGISTENSMRNLLDGSYRTMANFGYYGRNLIIAGEVRSDNVYSNGNSNRFTAMSTMQLLPTTADVVDLFKQIYASVANANVIINAELSDVEGGDDNMKHMLGEAYAIRALAHFDALRLFGQQYLTAGDNLGISYIKEFKGEEPQVVRGSVEENKTELYNDIEDAIRFLQEGAGSAYALDKTNITLGAVYALESRIATYFGDYDKLINRQGEIEEMLSDYPITPANDLVEYWNQSTPGAASIFELAQSTTDNQGINGLSYIYRGDEYGDIEAFANLLEDADFDKNDIRASENMIAVDGRNKLRNVGKFPSMGTALGSDNIKVFRIEEVVLNQAEALFATGNEGKALEFLNKVPQHRNASSYTTVNFENILKERRKELLFEGFRFFDLERMNLGIPDIDRNTVNNHGEIPAGDYKFAMPIPQQEMDTNKKTVQNPNY